MVYANQGVSQVYFDDQADEEFVDVNIILGVIIPMFRPWLPVSPQHPLPTLYQVVQK